MPDSSDHTYLSCGSLRMVRRIAATMSSVRIVSACSYGGHGSSTAGIVTVDAAKVKSAVGPPAGTMTCERGTDRETNKPLNINQSSH
jgi:hypothetical protein